MLRILLTLAVIALIVYAATDCAGSTDDERRGVPKPLWMLIIIVLPVFGAVAWLIQRYSGRKQRPRPTARGPRPPVAPDDDPDFLWRLEQERRRRQAGGATGPTAREPDDTTPHADGPGGAAGTTGDASGSAGASDDPTDDATDNGKGTGSHS